MHPIWQNTFKLVTHGGVGCSKEAFGPFSSLIFTKMPFDEESSIFLNDLSEASTPDD